MMCLTNLSSRLESSRSTHASTQHMNTNPSVGPINGIKRNEKETTSEVNTMTMRYAEVAMEFSSPVYVDGGSLAAREPC